MLVAARSDEHESKLRPCPGARPPRRGPWTAGARRPPIAFVTAVKVPNDRMRGSQFSSWNISLPYRRYGCASFLCIMLADPTPDKRALSETGLPPNAGTYSTLSQALQSGPSTSCRASSGRLSNPRREERRVGEPAPWLSGPGDAGGRFHRAGLQTGVRRAPAKSFLL